VKRVAIKSRKRLQRGRRLNAMSAKERLVVAPRWRAAKKQIDLRSGGQCEVRLSSKEMRTLWRKGAEKDAFRFVWYANDGVWRCLWPARDTHHVVKRSRGRDDSPENLLDVCRACHEWFDAAHSEARGRLTALPGAAGATPTCAVQRSDKWATA
jgi:hypothetical protein